VFLARVVGTVVATRKEPGLTGTKLLVIQPFDLLEHTCSLEVEEGQGGVPLAAVVAGHPFPLCLEHGGEDNVAAHHNPVGASLRPADPPRNDEARHWTCRRFVTAEILGVQIA